MRRNARIRWIGSEFKSSHDREVEKSGICLSHRLKKQWQKIHFFLGAKLFNGTPICLNINFHRAHPCWGIYQKRILYQVEEKLEVPPRLSSREKTMNPRLHTTQQTLTYDSIRQDLGQERIPVPSPTGCPVWELHIRQPYYGYILRSNHWPTTAFLLI